MTASRAIIEGRAALYDSRFLNTFSATYLFSRGCGIWGNAFPVKCSRRFLVIVVLVGKHISRLPWWPPESSQTSPGKKKAPLAYDTGTAENPTTCVTNEHHSNERISTLRSQCCAKCHPCHRKRTTSLRSHLHFTIPRVRKVPRPPSKTDPIVKWDSFL